MSRIRTLDFLPAIFQTPTNSQFLGATLDQLVNPPVKRTMQGYVGSRLGYGVNASNYYVTEPTKERTDYQLDPGVVFLKEKETVARDFISYPGILNSLELQDGITDDNGALFNSQIYSFDPFCSLDPIINFNQYYWIPDGLPAVTVTAATVFSTNDFIVTYTPSAYSIRAAGSATGVDNPTLTFLRGGTYSFTVDQSTQFWIQGEPGVSGTSATQTNLSVRDVYGVTNNGESKGVVKFVVPQKDAQQEWENITGNNAVDLICTIPAFNTNYYNQKPLNGMKLSELGNIDGVTALNGRTVMFYNTGITNEIGYVSNFYDEGNYDTNYGNLVAQQTVNVTDTTNTGNITISALPSSSYAVFNGSLQSNILTVTSITDAANAATLGPGFGLSGTYLDPISPPTSNYFNDTFIVEQLTGTAGGPGTYRLNNTFNSSSQPLTNVVATYLINSSITFTGTSFGGIELYNSNVSSIIPATGMTLGDYYYIKTVGTTNWINAGVSQSAAIDATISGTQLIINNTITGIVNLGQTVTGSGLAAGTVIVDYDPVNTQINGKPTYTINHSQSIPSVTTMALYDIRPGTVFNCSSVPVTGTGTVAEYNPTIYYIANVFDSTTIQISKTINGPVETWTTASGSSLTGFINQGLYEEGYYTTVNENYYLITYIGDSVDPEIRLTPYPSVSEPDGTIPIDQKITPRYGTQYIGLPFVRLINPDTTSIIARIPYISAPLDTLYYQDGTNPNCVGVIKLIENNDFNYIDVEKEILGKPNYTAPNGVVFTNGLKVKFQGTVFPESYATGEYYVEGVGTTAADGGGIQLIPVDSLIVTEDIEPNIPDYITIARNSLNKNAWARSNRWFHDQVIHATAQYNEKPAILDEYARADNKAKRPIIEFYPNLKLYNSGTYSKPYVDFVDTRTTDAFYYVENQACYYPDVETYTTYTGVINANTDPVAAYKMIPGQWYEIYSLGTTGTDVWTSMGAVLVQDGAFQQGTEYIITSLGTTDWNAIAGTFSITYAVGDKIVAAQSGTGTGGGQALEAIFNCTSNATTLSPELEAGTQYTIVTLGTTQWQTVGASILPHVGEVFIATGPGIGTGTALQGNGTVKIKTSATIEIDVDQVVGTLSAGQWINDLILGQASHLPTGTRILDIKEVSGKYIITVYYPTAASVLAATLVSFVANSKDPASTDNKLALFDGAKIVFANEVHESTRAKIYVAKFNQTGSEPYPVLILTEAVDSDVVENDEFPVKYGFNYNGASFYYYNNEYIEAQKKTTQNQAPLFDIFDNVGISYGNTDFYNSSTFKGSKLFNYQIGTGINDAVLGFPISYSSIKNVNDIRFEVSLYTDQFNYVEQGVSKTESVNKGYIYNYKSRTDYDRMIGWQTAIAPSQQYQVFQFTYIANAVPLVLEPDQTIDFVVTCDVPQLSTDITIWPSLQVFKNNVLLTLGTDYTVVNTDTSTVITIKLVQDVDTPIEVLIYSDQVSETAYYSIPINLSNNPFNGNPNTVDLGDIRGQYQSIYNNSTSITGQMFGSNNYRDLGNLVPYGTRIIQNSASLVLPGAFLRTPNTNLFEALMFNSREYIKFKAVLVDTVNRIANNQKYDPATLLDQAMDDITAVKTKELPFFWSDMLPSKSAYITTPYSFANGQDTSIFPLSKTYDFASANYNGVLVYLLRKVSGVLITKQLIKGIDYTISADSPSLTVTTDLIAGDKIIVKEYNATYGSYVPNTPTKLGLYPAYIPSVIYDTSYANPTWFIQGHDGSLNKLYGDYNQELGMCVDFRDQILLEFETRIYNNLKLSNVIPIQPAIVIPGYFRETPLSYDQFTEIYSVNFLNWVGQNRLNYKTHLEYQSGNPWTYNYRGSKSSLDRTTTILQGNWRGIYTYFFDTPTPNTSPWEMVGYTAKPSWWEDRYGPAPYTSNNLILWTDMENGVINYDAEGNPVTVDLYKRPGLLNILPVDSSGKLKTPLQSVIGDYNPYGWNRSWIVGDDAAVEYSYRKSSTYPFDLMKLQALMKPAMFYNLAVDLDNYKYNLEFNQFLVNDRTHLVPSEIAIYGNGTAKTSYINWLVDYQKQWGIDATAKIETLLNNLDVRLVYRLAGFSDKTLLKFFVEKGSPGAPNPSLLIPDESYQVLLYDNQPSEKIVYSGVVVQLVDDGYAVYGNNQTTAYFKILKPVVNGKKTDITVQDVTVTVPNEYGPEIMLVPYGTVYYSEQEVAQFLLAYGRYLESQGMVFEYQNNSVVFSWMTMVNEFLYWAQTGWSISSVVTLNPAAENILINKDSLVVQPLTYTGTNFILNNNMYPIQNKDLNIFRQGTVFDVKPLNEGDALTYAQFNLSCIEHGIVFNNETLFNDVIYNLETGLRQNRIYVRGTKSAEWNGTMFASGFIYNQDNILDWVAGAKYAQGSIVKYKNKYFTALTTVQPNNKFVSSEWKQTNYDAIQKGLLPNSSTRSAESAVYYDVNKANLEQDADLLSFSLIGFRPRTYMADADLTDITQVNVYKNLIKDKGTLNAMKAFKGANLPQGGIDYDIYENWAILQGSYGGLLNDNFIEFSLDENLLTNNPSIVGLTNGNDVPGAQQLVPLYALRNYGSYISNTDILPLTDTLSNTLFNDAGYVNANDVKMLAYSYFNLPTAKNINNKSITINNLYVNDYVWIASYNSQWQILSPTSIGQVLQVIGNLDNTSTVVFKENHNLNQYDTFAIINFDSLVNGYFIVSLVKNQKEVLINLILPAQTRSITGQGIGLKFQSHRTAQPGGVQNLPLLNNEFVKNKAWVDQGTDGNWAVYEKSINYKFDKEFTRSSSVNFGSAVAYSPLSGYLLSDPAFIDTSTYEAHGKVYRYRYDETIKEYLEDQILTQEESFGTTIAHKQNIYVISQPTTNPKVFIYTINKITQSDDIILYQEISAPVGATNFGSALALSGDLNWLFVSDYNDALTPRNNVHVYCRKNISVDVPSNSLIAGSTYQIVDPGTITNWALISDDVIAGIAGTYFIYNGYPVDGSGTFLQVDYQYANTITLSAVTTADEFGHALSTDYYGTMLFVGTPNADYSSDINNWGKTFVYNRLVQTATMHGSNIPFPTNPVFTFIWNLESSPTYVNKNGLPVASSNYQLSGNNLTYTGAYNFGDILTVSGSEFVLVQTLETEQTPRIGVAFGTSIDNNVHATEVIVGAPFALSSTGQEGAGYRFTNAGAKFGIIIGTADVNVVSETLLLINGYEVLLPQGDASVVAQAINSAGITNIQAANSNGKLIISIVDQNITVAEQKLLLAVTDITTLSQLGINLYTQTQVILCPHAAGPTQFGSVIKFNEHDSVAIGAPIATRYEQTLFDFSDDENLDNDTVFDNNSTQFVDHSNNVGAVYTFDYLANYNESLSNIGAFTYAQSVNAQTLVNGAQPRYGAAIDYNTRTIVVGAPDYREEDIDGQVVIYKNSTGTTDWAVYRHPGEIVDINKIKNIQLFSAETNNTLQNLDYIDPSQNKLLGAVRENIDFISNIDPAGYNTGTESSGFVWGLDQVGSIWLDTSGFRYMNYHQNDISYNAKYWANLFPGSDVAVYTWIVSNVTPGNYQGPGTPIDSLAYTVQTTINASNVVTPVYCFWVRNTNIVFTKTGKTLADTNIENYIKDPLQSGISYLAPLASNAVALYNCKPYINAADSVLNIGFNVNTQDNPAHQEFALIRQNYATDFLPGLPNTGYYLVPESLYNRLLESLSGTDNAGAVVPDPFLPKLVQSGVLARPRQSFFYNRYLALKNYIQYANAIMSSYPITETRSLAVDGFLQKSGTYFDTTLYWTRVNWWAPGYNNNTKSALQVPIYADLSTLNEVVATGTIVTVSQGQNSNSSTETYIYEGAGIWTRIGLANGTIEFSSKLYDYQAAQYGFGGSFYDSDIFDVYPSQETYWIVRALTEQIYIDDLLIHRNKSLILLFEYIQEETVENQNYLPWLNKTSLIDVSHKIRELKPIQNYLSDNQEFLSGYVNETKPYHVVVKDFLFDYTGSDTYPGNITDFDVPADFNTTIDTFVSPQLKYDASGNAYQYSSTASIWQEQKYVSWFNNYGVSVGQYINNNIVGQPDYPVTILASYISTTTQSFVVDSVQGLPVSGTIKIYDLTKPTEYELIGYSYIDKENNVVGGLTRGVNKTTISSHIPGTTIFMDLPAVILLYGGRGYANPPKITAVLPEGYPAPRVEAQIEAVMALGTVSEITVKNPGSGYAITPEIKIEPALTYSFDSANVNIINNTIQLYAPGLGTHDLVKYVAGTTKIGGLVNNQWYYVAILDNIPSSLIALYESYSDAVQDKNRVLLDSKGTGTQTLELGARAIAVPVGAPVRENNITLRFDRTSYDTQITDWTPNTFYGSQFVGYYTEAASSGLLLDSIQPDINTVLASAEGTVFPIESVSNNSETTWSSGPDVSRRIAAINNSQLQLSFESSVDDQNPSRSTLGFTVGMPVKFVGDTYGSGISENTVYYVAEIIDLEQFTISETQYGPMKSLTNFVPMGTMECFTGTVTNTAVIATVYPGIRTVTGTSSFNNSLTVVTTYGNTGGTSGLYTDIPIHFTGNIVDRVTIVKNKVYYVTSVLDDQSFTMSTEQILARTEVRNLDPLTNQIVCADTSGFSIGDPVLFQGMVVNGTSSTLFGNIVAGQVYYISNILSDKIVTISVPNGVGTVIPTINTYCYMVNQINSVEVSTETGQIVCTDTTGFAVNDPVVFDTMIINSSSVPTYGNIVKGQIYYIDQVVNNKVVTIKETLTGSTFYPGIVSPGINTYTTCYMTTQKKCVRLESEARYANVQYTSGTPIVCENTYEVLAVFKVNDAVVFDDMMINGVPVDMFGNIVKGQTYYIRTLPDSISLYLTISTTVGGPAFNAGFVLQGANTYCHMNNMTTGMTMNVGMPVSPGQVDGQEFTFYTNNFEQPSASYYLKVDTATTMKVYSDPLCQNPVSGIDFPYQAGSVMLLPEPFYFQPDIVKYKGHVYLCMVSNNDPEFVQGNWLQLPSSDRRLNALDRIQGFYAPTVNMPGRDLTQLLTGLVYPNTTYQGNDFEISKQYALDTLLKDQAFSPAHINIPAIVFNGINCLAPANLPSYSAMIADPEVNNSWLLAKMANQPLALTDIIYVNGVYLMTSTNNATPLFKSSDYQVWNTSGWFVPYDTAVADIEFDKTRLIASGLSLTAAAGYDTQYVAVGNNIIVTDDLAYWYERLVLDSTNKKFNNVAYVQTTGLTGYVAVGQNGTNAGIIYISTDGAGWAETTPTGTTVNYHGVAYGFDQIFVVGANRTILSSSNGVTWTQVLTGSNTLNDIVFADNTLVAVGEGGLVLVSTDGITWTVKATATTENLNSAVYAPILTEWTVVGNNNTVLKTEDITASPVVWRTAQLFAVPEPEYTVQGDPFMSGYGPEELVPGIVRDQLTMIVNTRPGTNWPAAEYAHVGYNVNSIELDYDVSNIYSFENVVNTPSVISVFKIVNGLSVSLYEPNGYTVDWVNKTVSLLTPLVVGEQLRIDAYEAGNGDQLAESSTDNVPIITNTVTGFDEIILDCNYIGSDATGGGIVVPGTSPVGVIATETMATDDIIICSSASQFVLNDEIYFEGSVFGGVATDTVYYVKTIDTVTNAITISDSISNANIAGSTFSLSSDTGNMTVVIQRGPGDLYTEPAVFRNGNKLAAGHTNYVVATNSTTNALLAYSTGTLTTDQRITFSDTIFGGITAQTTYYVKDILSDTQFTISDSPGGSVVPLTAAAGSAIFITEDYAVAMADNQINAKVIFAANYDQTVDYISYTFFNKTTPQYGFTMPQTQVFEGDGVVGPYVLINYLAGTNPENAVVEINGLRIDKSEYVIDFSTATLTFNTITPSVTDVVAVTTFNDTQRQYLFTNSYTNKQVTAIAAVDTNITVTEPTVRIITATPHNLVTNDIIRINGTLGAEQLDDRLFVVEVQSATELGIYYYEHGATYNTAAPVTSINTYISGGYVSKYQTYMLENTYVTSNGSTYLVVADPAGLVVDTPVYFTEDGPVYAPYVDIGSRLNSIPELFAGKKYYIVGVFGNTVSISATQGGPAISTLTPSAGPYHVRLTQWEQTNVNRLWVTINGERVPSSKLVLNPANELSIASVVMPSDVVIITSMMPTATPDAETYLQIVDQNDQAVVYRANIETTTYNTASINEFTTIITVNDISRITTNHIQQNIAGSPVLDKYTVALNVDKNEILEIQVYNNNPARLGYIPAEYTATVTSGLGPDLVIAAGSWIAAGDSLTITVLLGGLLYVNGEYMIIRAVDSGANKLAVQRGALGSPTLHYIPVNSKIYGLLSQNRMNSSYYTETWNKIPGVYNVALGDPLQIAQGPAPAFLRENHNVGI